MTVTTIWYMKMADCMVGEIIHITQHPNCFYVINTWKLSSKKRSTQRFASRTIIACVIFKASWKCQYTQYKMLLYIQAVEFELLHWIWIVLSSEETLLKIVMYCTGGINGSPCVSSKDISYFDTIPVPSAVSQMKDFLGLVFAESI